MPIEKIFEHCFLCDKQCQMGPHLYELYDIKSYQIGVCEICYKGNWDGWNPRHEDKILQHLKEKGIEVPQRNQNKWFPRDLPIS